MADSRAARLRPNGSGKSILGSLVLALGSGLRALPIRRGKERLSRWIPLDRLAESGCFHGRTFRGKQSIVWDASTLPDVMTKSMLWNGSYQDDVLACIARAIKPGDQVFDIGAHFGLMSIFASKLVGEHGKVIAFEPSPRNREVLAHHCRLNRSSNVIIEALGLLDRPGEFDFYMTTGHSWNSTFDAAFAQQQTFDRTTVRADTLDNFVERTGLRPALLKIDTEGTELECLLGGIATLRRLRPVLVIEYNSLSQSRPGEDEQRVIRLLQELGYRMFIPQFSFWGNVTGQFEELRGDESLDGKLLNVLCLPESRVDLLKVRT
ncbi:MAG: FkbM family methyltransferase [Pirellulales bacterium]